LAAQASTYAFRPNDGQGDPDDVFDLDHHYAYTWGISGATYDTFKAELGHGSAITSATLTFYNIWDWINEPNDRLWVNLLDKPKKGVKTFADNADDIESTLPGSNYFNNQGTSLGYWTDPNGGSSNYATNITFTFTTAQLGALTSYIMNGGATDSATGYADFGLAFDPDCHYYNTGIELKIVTQPTTRNYVPDGGITAALFGLSFLSLAGFRRLLRR